MDHSTPVIFFFLVDFCPLNFSELLHFLQYTCITLIIREKKIYVCFGKKNDKVSSNFHPFSIYCYGLIFTLLLMAPPEDPAGSSLVTASVPPEYDPDLDPG